MISLAARPICATVTYNCIEETWIYLAEDYRTSLSFVGLILFQVSLLDFLSIVYPTVVRVVTNLLFL